MNTLSLTERIDELIAQHGTLRAAARVLEVDAGYLSRLRYGEKDDPGETLLRRMGLRRVVAYERRTEERPWNPDYASGGPGSESTRPSEQDAPGSSIGLGAEGEQ